MESNVEKLKQQIDKKTKEIISKNILLNSLKNRNPTSDEVSQYLINSHYLITYTQPNLKSALLKSIQLNKKKLAEYFLEKIFEEIGHEQWAEEDLKNNRSKYLPGVSKPTSSIIELTKYLSQISENEPLLYATYILVSEYTMANYGKIILDLFRTNKPGNQMSVISNHVELDAGHADEDEKKLYEILSHTSERKIASLIKTVNISLNLLDQSIAEIYEPNHSEHQSLSVSASL